MTLLAFAAERRAAAPLLLDAGARRYGSICPAHRALSNKPAARHSGCKTMGQRDNGPTPDRYIYPAARHIIQAASIKQVSCRE